jgi:hypothetical protein
MAEQKPRSAKRRRCYLGARFIFNGGRNSLDAVVRNVSLSGARLEAEDLSSIPPEFDLLIGGSVGESRVRHARRVWQNRGAVGVAFVAAA